MSRTPESVSSFLESHPNKQFDCFGKKVEYISSGEGSKTILVVPGGGQTAQSNFALIESLELKFRVVSPSVYDFESIDEFCNTIDKLLDQEEVDTVHVYGLSVGGLLAQSYLWRKRERVESIIISHSCTPESKTYERKDILPLKALSIVLPLIPDSVIRSFARLSAGKIQGVSGENAIVDPIMSDLRSIELNKYFTNEFYEKYLSKTLLNTWINLHTDFYNNEKFSPDDISGWKGKALILRTDNDPLMQDEGYFAKLYPDAEVHTFSGTGHMTFHYQFTEMMKIINKFLD